MAHCVVCALVGACGFCAEDRLRRRGRGFVARLAVSVALETAGGLYLWLSGG